MSGRIEHPVGPRILFFAFEGEVRCDPTIEGVVARPDYDARDATDDWRPNIREGAEVGALFARLANVRLCCTALTVTRIHDDPVGTSQSVVEKCVRQFFSLRRDEWSEPVPPLHPDWLTSDVVALARGIAASGAPDGLPALTDALLDAGCDHPLALEHLRTCPDHGTSCWVVEMICAQTAARDGG